MSQLPDTESSRSRDRILDLMLKSEEPLSVQSLAASLGISRNAAHQQVMALEREGLLERDSAIRTRGRPSQGFRLSEAGNATFPRQYALLARQLLAELGRYLPAEEFQRAMTRIGVDLAAGLSLGGEGDDSERIRAIAGAMSELGYESATVEEGDGIEIEAHNCVFHDLAFADDTICEVDLSLLRSLSGQDVEHRRCMARGAKSCRFAFRPKLSKA